MTQPLAAQGFRIVNELMAYNGTSNPITTVKIAIDQAAKLIEAEVSQGRDVILINHSFGGTVGCSASKGFTKKDPSKLKPGSGHVIGIAQIAAFTPPAETGVFDLRGGRTPEAFHQEGPDGWEVVEDATMKHTMFNDMPPDQQEYWAGTLIKCSSSVMDGPGGREGVVEGYLDVPVWYFLCELDQAIPIQAQEGMVKAAVEKGADITTRKLNVGHSPFLSQPKETLKFIEDAIADLTARSS